MRAYGRPSWFFSLPPFKLAHNSRPCTPTCMSSMSLVSTNRYCCIPPQNSNTAASCSSSARTRYTSTGGGIHIGGTKHPRHARHSPMPPSKPSIAIASAILSLARKYHLSTAWAISGGHLRLVWVLWKHREHKRHHYRAGTGPDHSGGPSDTPSKARYVATIGKNTDCGALHGSLSGGGTVPRSTRIGSIGSRTRREQR